jgi:hypothetical protein
MEKLYRIEGVTYAAYYDEDYYSRAPGRSELHTREYLVIGRTRKGAWIDVYGEKKFVNLTARKKFACETVEEARESFKQRKRRQIGILSAQLEQAKKYLSLVHEVPALI